MRRRWDAYRGRELEISRDVIAFTSDLGAVMGAARRLQLRVIDTILAELPAWWWVSPEPALLATIDRLDDRCGLLVTSTPITGAPAVLAAVELLAATRGARLIVGPPCTDPLLDAHRRLLAASRPGATRELVRSWALAGRSITWITDELARLAGLGLLGRAPSRTTVGRWLQGASPRGGSTAASR